MVYPLALSLLCGACQVFDLPEDKSGNFAACCEGRGTCLPSGLLGADADRLTRDSCESDLKCVPEELLSLSASPFETCAVRSTGAEGRCLPECLEQVQSQGDRVAQDGCTSGHRCIPCNDPVTGAPTEACAQENDPGSQELPFVFAGCCEGLGRCVPATMLTSEQTSSLGRDDCERRADLCVPYAFVMNADSVPASCTVPELGAEGRCLLSCLPDVAARSARLHQATCETGELCTPCFDPATGASTRACELGAADAPKHAPVLLDTCCSDRGRCVPNGLLTDEERSHVDQGACSAADLSCVPSTLLTDAAGPPVQCTVGWLGAEGRCLSECLPEVAVQGDRIARDDCTEGERCVPCFDPLDGSETGACSWSNDRGPREQPVTLAACGAGGGRCLPREQVPSDQRALLGPDSCTDANALCVPVPFLENADYRPAGCWVAPLEAEGRCLSEFLPAVAAGASTLSRSTCASAQLCVPCFDPRTGSATGACSIGRDPGPLMTSKPLDSCCGAQGTCLPGALVPEQMAPRLSRQECSDSGALCVAPRAALDDPTGYQLERCHDGLLGAEGRCLPSCLPEIAAQAAYLSEGTCTSGSLCAPCFDPLSGSATGACTQGGDSGPNEPAKAFQQCCEDGEQAQGICLPSSLLPMGAGKRLAREHCTAEDAVCVPRALASSYRDPSLSGLATCSSLGVEGRCVPRCSLSSDAALLSDANCGLDEACVPCELLGSPTGVCPP